MSGQMSQSQMMQQASFNDQYQMTAAQSQPMSSAQTPSEPSDTPSTASSTPAPTVPSRFVIKPVEEKANTDKAKAEAAEKEKQKIYIKMVSDDQNPPANKEKSNDNSSTISSNSSGAREATTQNHAPQQFVQVGTTASNFTDSQKSQMYVTTAVNGCDDLRFPGWLREDADYRTLVTKHDKELEDVKCRQESEKRTLYQKKIVTNHTNTMTRDSLRAVPERKRSNSETRYTQTDSVTTDDDMMSRYEDILTEETDTISSLQAERLLLWGYGYRGSTSNSDLSTLVGVNSVESDGKIESPPDHNQPSDFLQRRTSSKDIHQVPSNPVMVPVMVPQQHYPGHGHTWTHGMSLPQGWHGQMQGMQGMQQHNQMQQHPSIPPQMMWVPSGHQQMPHQQMMQQPMPMQSTSNMGMWHHTQHKSGSGTQLVLRQEDISNMSLP